MLTKDNLPATIRSASFGIGLLVVLVGCALGRDSLCEYLPKLWSLQSSSSAHLSPGLVQV